MQVDAAAAATVRALPALGAQLHVRTEPITIDSLVATGDVLYDVAFLLMDLVERGIGPAANTVLNRYLAETRRGKKYPPRRLADAEPLLRTG